MVVAPLTLSSSPSPRSLATNRSVTDASMTSPSRSLSRSSLSIPKRVHAAGFTSIWR